MMHYYDYGGGSGYEMMSVFGALLHFIFWLIIIMIIVRFLHRRKGKHWHGLNNHMRSPMDIIKERYAKGEITREEDEEKKKDVI